MSQIRGHVNSLKGDLRRHFVDHADETRQERNARIMREKPARFDGDDEISLPLSRKRRVPVYGNSRAAAFDAHAARAGNPHVFGEPVLTQRENELQLDVVAAMASSRCHFASMSAS